MYAVPGQIFVRCRLGKVIRPPGRTAYMAYRVDWVPQPWAVVGHVIALRCPAELWLNGWEVMRVFDQARPLLDLGRDESAARPAVRRRRLVD